jgi:ABC-type lipoprotein release transport system permease subunit
MFVLRMAWRETRASWGRLLFFFLCVAIGVSAIVVLRSVVQTVRRTLTAEARQMIGADLVVQSSRKLAAEQQASVDGALAGPGVLDRTNVVDTQTMASSTEGRGRGFRLVELRGVETAFPFYGAPELEGGRRYEHALLANRGTLVQRDLLEEFGLAVGDPLLYAGQPFTIRGVVTRDRMQRSGGFAFGPRVYVDLADLRTLPLLGFGSRATYQTLVRVDAAVLPEVTRRVRASVAREAASVRTWRTVEDRVGRNLTLAENYLSLVGFAMVVLGGIGVWSVTRVVVQQKMRSVAILKCVGATSGRVLGIYVLQVTWLAAGGCLLGVALAAVGLAAIPARVVAPLGITEASITFSAAAQGVGVGLLVSLLFALVPLLEVRRVKPLLLLRADAAGQARRRDWLSVLAASGDLAGGFAPGRAVRLWGARGRGPCPHGRGSRARGRRGAPRAIVTLRPASRRRQPAPAEQSNAGDPAVRRPRLFLHPRGPRASGEPAVRVHPASRRARARLRADRHPVRPGRRRRRRDLAVSATASAPAADDARARRRRRRPARDAGDRGRCAAAGRAHARVWPDVSWVAPGQRGGHGRSVLGRAARVAI